MNQQDTLLHDCKQPNTFPLLANKNDSVLKMLFAQPEITMTFTSSRSLECSYINSLQIEKGSIK